MRLYQQLLLYRSIQKGCLDDSKTIPNETWTAHEAGIATKLETLAFAKVSQDSQSKSTNVATSTACFEAMDRLAAIPVKIDIAPST